MWCGATPTHAVILMVRSVPSSMPAFSPARSKANSPSATGIELVSVLGGAAWLKTSIQQLRATQRYASAQSMRASVPMMVNPPSGTF